MGEVPKTEEQLGVMEWGEMYGGVVGGDVM